MEARDIAARVKALNKATAAGEPAQNIMSILDALKKDVVPTEDLLRVRSLDLCLCSAPRLTEHTHSRPRWEWR